MPAIMIGKLKVLRQAMPNLKKSRRVPGKIEEHPTPDMVALPEPNIFDWYCIKARLPGWSRQRIFQEQRYTHLHDVATLVCRALWKENWKKWTCK